MWAQKNQSTESGRRSGLFFDHRRLTLACVDGERALTTSVSLREGGDDGLPELQSIGAPYLNKSRLTSVLSTGSYELLLVTLPDVPQNELIEAVRWQIRELLKFPAEEAVIEIFDIPQQSNTGNKPMAYAAVTRRNALRQHVDTIHNAGFKPVAIDIPELCIRNVAARLPQDADGVALLHVGDERSTLTVTRQGVLYLMRHVDIGLNDLLSSKDDTTGASTHSSAVVLEVQRSLDYYESHYDRRPVTELVLAPGANIGRLPDIMREQLGLTVSPLDLASLFDLQNEIPTERHGDCLFAIGAALRSESMAA